MNNTECFEGIRAMLVDKDKKPLWKHQSVDEVEEEELAHFFDRTDPLILP